MADNQPFFCNWFSPISALAHHEAIPPTLIFLPSPSADISHCDVDNPLLSPSSIVIVPPSIVHRHHLPRHLPLPFSTTVHCNHTAGNCPSSSSANISHHHHRPYLRLLGPHPPNKGSRSSASSHATVHMPHHSSPTHCVQENSMTDILILRKQTKMALRI